MAVLDAGLHRQPAALRHRIPRIQKQIQKHLLQLVLDAGDQRRRRAQLAPHFHLARHQLRLEQRQHIADDGVRDRPGAISSALEPVERDRLSSPLTIFAARNVCCSIFSSIRVLGSSGSALLSSICVKLEMPVSGVFTSCATPAASRPTDAILSEICSCSSRCTRSVTSSMMMMLPTVDMPNCPLGAFSGAVAMFTRSRSPALRRTARERDAVQRGAVRRLALGGAQRLDKRAVEHLFELVADGLGRRQAVDVGERAVPAKHAAVQILDHEPVIERLDDVLVELLQPLQLARP